MQVTVTDHNEWEGESFSFVLEIDSNLAARIQAQEFDLMTIEYPTGYTQSDIDQINSNSDNSYMDRIGFYEIKKSININDGIDFYEDVFYKGAGLIKI